LGQPFVTLVPRPDEDGLDQGGIALPELQVSLGTYPVQHAHRSGRLSLGTRWDGSFVPFPRTEAERRASGDSRRSLEARYAHRADYVGKVNRAATAVADKGFLLPEEVDALIREAGELYDRVTTHDPADISCTYLLGD
jgi:Alpha/beta hydrolase domain